MKYTYILTLITSLGTIFIFIKKYIELKNKLKGAIITLESIETLGDIFGEPASAKVAREGLKLLGVWED